MSNSERIKVLILEDTKDHIAVAKAGLIPLAPETIPDIAGKNRAKLADEFFHIEFYYTLREAFENLEIFAPDITILDVELKDKRGVTIKGGILKTGLDLYRYIQRKDPSIQNILFTAQIGMYQSRMSEDELKHFRAKGTSGAGHENLAKKIDSYLYNIAKKIISDATPGVKARIKSDLTNLSQSDVLSNTYLFGKRKLLLKDLLIFCSYPVLKKEQTLTYYTLEYINPEERILELFEDSGYTFGNAWRAEWKHPYLEDAILYYQSTLAAKMEQKISESISTIAKYVSLYIVQDPDDRFRGLGFGSFRTNEYRGSSISENQTFKEKFINILVVRRFFLLQEIFLRENVDAGRGIPKQPFKKYLQNFVNETLQGLKFKDSPYTMKELTQFGINLNMGFKTNTSGSFKRERVEIEKYIIYDFEREWLASNAAKELKQQMKTSYLI